MRWLVILLLSLSLLMGFSKSLLANDFFESLKEFSDEVARNTPVLNLGMSLYDRMTGNTLKDKVDRIEQRQETCLDRIREVAYNALETKRNIEDIYYFTKWGIEEGKLLAEELKKGNIGKIVGAMLEDGLAIPL